MVFGRDRVPPLQGEVVLGHFVPGRCPGLSHRGAFGAAILVQRTNTRLNEAQLVSLGQRPRETDNKHVQP